MADLENEKRIVLQIGKLLNQDSIQDHEKDWMVTNVDNDSSIKKILKKLRTSDIHVISVISDNKQLHIKDLPKLTALSQPTISRIVAKLEEEHLLEKFRTVKNDKEILVHLTTRGESIAHIHRSLEENIASQVNSILEKYPKNEVNHFITILNELGNIKI